MFNWKEATVEECANQIMATSTQSTSSVYKYHSGNGSIEMVEKIDKARALAKALKKLIEANQIAGTLTKEGYQIADYYPVADQAVDQ